MSSSSCSFFKLLTACCSSSPKKIIPDAAPLSGETKTTFINIGSPSSSTSIDTKIKKNVFFTIVDFKYRRKYGSSILEFGDPFASNLDAFKEAYPELCREGKTLHVLLINHLLSYFDHIFIVKDAFSENPNVFDYFIEHSHEKIILCYGEQDFLKKCKSDSTTKSYDYDKSIVVPADYHLAMTMKRWVEIHKIPIQVASAKDTWYACLVNKGFLAQFCVSLREKSLLPKTYLANKKTYRPRMIDEMKSENVILKLPNNTKGTGACVLSKEEAKKLLDSILKNDEHKTHDRLLKDKINEFYREVKQDEEYCFIIQELIQSDAEDLIEGYDPTYRAVVAIHLSESGSETRFEFHSIGMTADFPHVKVSDARAPRSCENMLVCSEVGPRSLPFPKSEESRVIAQFAEFFNLLFLKIKQYSLLSYVDGLTIDGAGENYLKAMVQGGYFALDLQSVIGKPPAYLEESHIKSLVNEMQFSLALLMVGHEYGSKFTTNFPHIIQLLFALQHHSTRYKFYIEMLKERFNKAEELIKALDICGRPEKNIFELTIALMEFYFALPDYDIRVPRCSVHSTGAHFIIIEGLRERIFQEKSNYISAISLHANLIAKLDKLLNASEEMESTTLFSQIFTLVYQNAVGQFGAPLPETTRLYDDIQRLLSHRLCVNNMPAMPSLASETKLMVRAI